MSRAADGELDFVSRLLGGAGVPVARLDAESASSAGIVVDLATPAVLVNGRWIVPTVTWLRHFSSLAMPVRRGALRQIFSAQSWQALADQLGAVSAVQVNSRRPGLLEQLAVASAHGISVPRTIVSSDLARASELLGSERVVVKALHQHFVEARPGQLSGVFPEIVSLHDAERGRALAPGGPPVVVQEHVVHDLEVRAYYTRGEITAFAVAKSDPAEPWLAPQQVSARRIEPPPAIAAAVQALAAAMSLEYGAFDFLSASEVPVFLEVNPSGDWRWLERKTGEALVSAAVASMLRDLHDRALSMIGSRGRSGTDLIRFLAGGGPAGPG